MPVMLPGCAWFTCWFMHPASVPASCACVITPLRVSRDPNLALILADPGGRIDRQATWVRVPTVRLIGLITIGRQAVRLGCL